MSDGLEETHQIQPFVRSSRRQLRLPPEFTQLTPSKRSKSCNTEERPTSSDSQQAVNTPTSKKTENSLAALQSGIIPVKPRRQGCGDAPEKPLEEARNPFQFDVVGRNQSTKLTPPRLKDLLSDIITLAKKVQRPAITTIHREQAEPNHLTGELLRPVGETEPNRLTGELLRPVGETEPNRLTGELLRPVGETEPNRLTGELLRPVGEIKPNRLTGELHRPVEQTEPNRLTGELHRPVEQPEPNRLTEELFRPVEQTEPNHLSGEPQTPEDIPGQPRTNQAGDPQTPEDIPGQPKANQAGEPQTPEVEPIRPKKETNLPAEETTRPRTGPI